MCHSELGPGTEYGRRLSRETLHTVLKRDAVMMGLGARIDSIKLLMGTMHIARHVSAKKRCMGCENGLYPRRVFAQSWHDRGRQPFMKVHHNRLVREALLYRIQK